jgi:murein DD-endopeptidase MepM/ murein hydrolase activator NlpD
MVTPCNSNQYRGYKMNINTRNSTPEKNWLIRLIGLSLLIIATSALATPAVPTLNSPSNGATNVAQSNVKFTWSASSGSGVKYRFILSRSSSFSGFNSSTLTCDSTCYTTTSITGTSLTINIALANYTYYWKVRAYDSTGTSSWSSYRSFTTAGSTKPLAGTLTVVNEGAFFDPKYNNGVSSSLWAQHLGTDYVASGGTSVYAISDGNVTWTKASSSYADPYNAAVIVEQSNGVQVVYGHITSSLAVGNKVTKGQKIGTVRYTDTSYGYYAHLHMGYNTKKGYALPTTLSNGNWGWGRAPYNTTRDYATVTRGWVDITTILKN